jgi:hypothetical protein
LLIESKNEEAGFNKLDEILSAQLEKVRKDETNDEIAEKQ